MTTRRIIDVYGRSILVDDTPSTGTSTNSNSSPGAFLLNDAQDGEQGFPGPRGQDGAAGATGSQGATGPAIFLLDEAQDGEQGFPGRSGTDGINGTNGTNGATGPAVFLEADQGEQGDIGPPGRAGADGAQGIQGPAGPAIFLLDEAIDGEPGPPGPAGRDGTSGSSNVGSGEIDFGAFPGANEASVAITGQASIVAGSKITITPAAVATSDHTLNDNAYAAMLTALTPGTITAATGFIVYARSEQKMQGKLPFNWSWA